nr:hypothetical protein [Tanacetum cinerariifolium]
MGSNLKFQQKKRENGMLTQTGMLVRMHVGPDKLAEPVWPRLTAVTVEAIEPVELTVHSGRGAVGWVTERNACTSKIAEDFDTCA